MAKKCINCNRKLSSNLFNNHPLKCDECWSKELLFAEKHKKKVKPVKRTFVKDNLRELPDGEKITTTKTKAEPITINIKLDEKDDDKL